MLVFNLSNNRSKSMHWHTQSCWCWWIIHTDNNKDCWPKWTLHAIVHKNAQTPFGNCLNAQGPNGPNMESDNASI
jgi:hypothetical protein